MAQKKEKKIRTCENCKRHAMLTAAQMKEHWLDCIKNK
jgi:hypothetical protein